MNKSLFAGYEMDNQLLEKVKKECCRIEEDALYSSKSHYNASSPWEKVNLIIGIPVAILAAVAGLTALKNLPTATIVISIVLTSLTALNTALNPSKRASQYKSAAGDYNNLKNDVRIFREIELFETTLTDKEIKERLKVFSDRRNQLNQSSPTIPQWAYKQTQSNFKNDFVRYEIDKEKS